MGPAARVPAEIEGRATAAMAWEGGGVQIPCAAAEAGPSPLQPLAVMNPLLGRWRIKASEACSADELEAEGAARLDLEVGCVGRFRMGRLEGEIDWRGHASAGGWRAQFTWVGSRDGEPASGRGWVRLVDDRRLDGKIFIHRAEDPRFQAVRA